MNRIAYGLVMLALGLLCIVVAVICNCWEMKKEWQERKPPRIRDYLWKTVETVLEFFS